MADDLAVMLKHAGIDKAVLVGLSMGGMIAQHFAIHYPEQTTGLVLIATSSGLPHARVPHMTTIKKLAELPFIAREEARKSLSELLLPKAEQHNMTKHLGGWDEVMREEKPRPHSFLLQLGAVATHYTGKKLQDIDCPTVIMTGDEDVLVPPINSKILKSRLPHAQLKELPGVGHAVEALAPEAVIASIQDVLNEAS
jgi:pimeloyl-ACP methyl ester carboxylesterase